MSSAAAPDLSPYICRYGVLWLAEDPAARHRRIDGTVVFTDLSGFTALSERLTAAGRVGAEEMATRLDNVFTSLLAEARDRGGSLVHFGGDALALLFSGDGHEVRAVATAAAMNRALKPHKRMETPTGVVKLGMSTGVWSGDVDLFLLGKRSQQLLLAGPAATGVTALEGAASSGEVLVSARTAAALPASCTRPWSDNVAMLARAPRDRAWEPVDVPDGVDVTKLLPVALRRHLLVGGGEPEHRSVTIAFVRWTGLDALLQSEGPGRVGGRLDELVARAEELTLEWGITLLATDLSGDGGKLLVAAGVPVLHEDDETRALLCMRALAAENPGGLGLRIGLHSGHAFAAAVGAPFRRTFTCIGDTVNTAARVMSKAEPGQVLATDDVLARSRRLFAVDALPEFAAKGKALPLRAFVVGEEQGARAADAADEVIGREAEIATLVGAVDDSAVVTISAEPGVGKTSLLAAALAALGDDATVLTTSCAAHAIADPYSAARPLLRQLLGDRRVADVAPALAPWAPLIAIVTGLDEPMTEEVQRLDPSLVTDRLQQAVAQLLDAGLPARALLVVDDAQWADGASAALLQHLVGQGDRRYGLWLAARPEVEPRFGEPTLQLGPLADDAALRLVRAHAAIPLLPVQARAIVARAAGNPLFLRELARAASALEDTADLPLSVESIVGSRIDRLSPADRDLLSIASVMGADIDDEIVDQIAPIAAEESTWERLADFVERAGDGHRFRHAVYQQVAYARLPFKQRRVLHGEIGGRIEKRDGDRAPADRLSLHFTEAQEWDAAWEWSLRAAEVASAAYARVDEMVALQRAIVAGDRAGKAASDRQGVMWQLAETASEGGQPHIAIATLQRLTKVVEPAVQARAYARLAVIHQEIGDAARSRRSITAGLARVPDGPGDAKAEMLATRALGAYRAGRHADVARWSRMALEASPEDAHKVLGHIWIIIGCERAVTGGDAAEAFTCAREHLLKAGDPLRASVADSNLAVSLFYAGRWTDAGAAWKAALETQRRAGRVNDAAWTACNLAELTTEQGRLHEAAGYLELARGMAEATETRGLLALLEIDEIAYRQRSLRLDEARELIASFVPNDPDTARIYDQRRAEMALLDRDAMLPPLTADYAHPPEWLDRLTAIARAQAGDIGGVEALREIAEDDGQRPLLERALADEARSRWPGEPPLHAAFERLLVEHGIEAIVTLPVHADEAPAIRRFARAQT